MTHDHPTTRPPHSAGALTRRALLRYGGLSLATMPLLALLRHARPVAATPLPSTGETRAGEWPADGRLQAFSTGIPLQFAAPFAFGALGAHWAAQEGDDAHLLVSVSADGQSWGPWLLMHPDAHGPAPGLALGRTDRSFAELLHLPPSRAVRCLAVDRDQRPVAPPPDLRLVYIDASAGPQAPAPDPVVTTFAAGAPTIVPRAGWGCDEKLRFKDGKEIWEREYYTTEKIIIHHTDTPNDQDPLQAIRSVYYYHAVTKGWGDIGYNFLIDRNGIIYEGRFGGDNVVGGHALQYNYGSVGIGLLGTFSPPPPGPSPSPSTSPTAAKPGTPTPTKPPTPTPSPTRPPVPPVITAAAEQALIQLTANKGRFLDLQARYYFIDKMIPNVVGHRDVLSTSCPGDTFYGHLPTIRQGAAALVGATPAMNVEIVGIAGLGESVVIRQPYTVKVTVKNTGTAIIPSYFDQGLTYTEGENYDAKKAPIVQGRFRIVADVANSPTAKADPYRWGFGRSLNPGETAEVPCRIVFTKAGERKLTFGLIQETMGYWAQGLDGPTVRVLAHPVDPVQKPANTGPNLLYFAETQHTLRGSLLRYWTKFGGLAQFGYPLTEEFPEQSESDGKTYTVQYFERARFELHPEFAGTDYEVLLGLVGRFFHAVDKPATALPGQRFFPETGHNLGGVFRSYWEQYGGLFIYGLPLTEEFTETSRIDNKPYTVQYFERARFEYHPENTGKSQVLLGHLGRQLLQDRGWLK